MKIERLLGIVMTLLEEEIVSASGLAQKYNVSTRTIQRDVDTLSVAGFPIYAEQGKFGGYRLMEHFTMDKVPVNVKEQQLMHQIVGCLSDMFEQRQFKHLEDKLGFGIQSGQHLEAHMKDDAIIKIDFSSWFDVDNMRSRLQRIYDAIDKRRSVIIKYGNNAGQFSTRHVDPYQLIFKENSWYMYSFCHMRQEFRMFRVNRIVACTESDAYCIREVPPPKAFSGEPVHLETIRLRFKHHAYGKVLDYFNVDSIAYHERYLEVNTKYPIDRWMEDLLMGFGDYLLDIEPEYLKARVLKRVQETLETLQSEKMD